MQDYSKFIKNPSSFILKYEIEKEQIIITTKATKQKEPHTHKATKNRIKYYEDRLERQYKIIIEKQEEILRIITDKKTTIYFIIAMIIGMLSAISAEFSDFLGMLLCGTSIFSLIINYIDNIICTQKLKTKIKLYDIFLQERKQIEEYSKTDQNIISNLSKQTIELINKNKKLKEEDLISYIFNIDFMDKVKLQDLKKLLHQYYISKGLDKSKVYKSTTNSNYTENSKVLRRKK